MLVSYITNPDEKSSAGRNRVIPGFNYKLNPGMNRIDHCLPLWDTPGRAPGNPRFIERKKLLPSV